MTGTLSAARWVALCAAAVLAACSADPVVDVHIEGECVPTSDAVQVLPTAPNFWAVGSVGVLGEYNTSCRGPSSAVAGTSKHRASCVMASR